MRLVEHAGHAVHIGLHPFGRENACITHLCPQGLQPSGGCLVRKDAVDKVGHAACSATPAAENPVGLVTNGVDAVVIVKGQVEIPARGHMEKVLLPVLVHIHAPIGVGIARVFAHQEMAQEALHIQAAAIAIGGIGILCAP